MLDSKKIFENEGYDYYSFIEEAIKPEVIDLKFKDLIESFSDTELGDKYIYSHQYACYKALCENKNVILKSGTGSGKTEAWLLYSIKHKIPTLAVYPTLALANDQIKRISLYCDKTGLSSLVLDANRKVELLKEYGTSKLRTLITTQDILVTNPALLMLEIKKIAKAKPSLIQGFLNRLKLIVFDEIDFYSPREIALILGLLDIISLLRTEDFQIVTLSAMIENPEELASFYTKVNKKETVIIEGKRFRVENKTYVVLGKDLKKVWERFKKHKAIIEKNIAREDLKAFEDFEYFKKNFYKFYEIANSLKLDIGSLDFNPVELLANYVNDDYVTLVFTRSINKAEELGRSLSMILSDELSKKVATHHHLILKEKRREVEEAARKGLIKILISPRTLSQGIDIGTVGRIVHYGLPESLREFNQREGRKGRRMEMPFSETIIIPIGSWDRKLLTRGIEALYEWLNMPIEKIVVNVDNKYRILFESVLKFQSPRLRKTLNEDEIKLLKDLKLVKGDMLSERGSEVERKLQFYEFALPYGINRILDLGEGQQLYLQEISHCDLVEKFQVGCFDPSNEAIVVNHKRGTSSRIVSAVIEERITEYNLMKKEEFLPVLEEYEEAKYKWGETPDLFSDYMSGRLSSEVLCVVNPPRKDFGKYYKIPNRVYWRLRSSKPRIKVIDGRTIIHYERVKLEVPTATNGRYSDYTYAAFYELDPSEDTDCLRIGLAYLMIILRKKLRIPFETILYDVGKFGDKKYFVLYEPDSAGLIFKLDWLEIKKDVEGYNATALDEILMEALDEYTYSDFLAKNLDWDLAKRYAIKVLDYMLLKERLGVKFKGMEITIPRPSRVLKKFSFDMIWFPLKEEFGKESGLLALAYYDGEDLSSAAFFVEEGKVKNFEEFMKILSQFVDEDFHVLIYDVKSKKEAMEKLGLKSLGHIFNSLLVENKVVDVKDKIMKTLNIDLAPLEDIEKLTETTREVNLSDLLYEYSDSKQRVSQAKLVSWKNFTKFLEEKSRKYLEENAKSIYNLFLILSELEKQSAIKTIN